MPTRATPSTVAAQLVRVARLGQKALLAAVLSLTACRKDHPTPALTSVEPSDFLHVPVPSEDGPKLASVANLTPIVETPGSPTPSRLGYLHAGARVARSTRPIDAPGCKGGWYAVRPRGFVCLDQGATLDLAHPTLKAMALSPKLEETLPYTYAKTNMATDLYSVDRGRPKRVKSTSKLPRHSRFAVVGSWVAKNEHDAELRLAMLPNGSFVDAATLSPVKAPDFSGVELGEQASLPLAFVVKRGVHTWALNEGEKPQTTDPLGYHQRVELTGKYRTVSGSQYWGTKDNAFVRHQDVTLIRRRNTFPDFATDNEKWIDVSVTMGTLVLYEGKKPIFATLVSVGRDRLDEEGSASTTRGTFEIVAKHITHVELDPTRAAEGYEVYDVPWALELSSGQMIHAAFWHDRFGIEFGPGNLQLSPADAHRLWAWADPELPSGWYAAYAGVGQKRVRVVIRT
ncbi:MAG: L,D-transpeptidase [Polyangiaceae bacterium]|nr:L,D-transpeptidase [Polyangiaceae bacterium]